MFLRPAIFYLAFVTVIVAALSLGPSFAHVLEAPPRLKVWSPDLWRETTVFNAQFWTFAAVGAPLDLSAIALTAVLAALLRDDHPAFGFAAIAAVLYALSLVAWFALVAPVNGELATWVPGPIPGNFEAVRLRWEIGHMVVAALKLAGFAALAFALLYAGRQSSS
ncbi:DUF1772 domain-containing protein [Pseudaminobacter sp. NGMCC 1.201702]|uniref:DUF1772 domain-containing protein n=1 Tax=Pseudaminobacter sp. NGMCC 1.201702 TaxID=3391825 RepID=UPI0039F061D7